MAYIIGLLTPEEEKELEERGWELEEAPKELGPEKDIPGKAMKMVWVDSGMVDVMSGPDWEEGYQELQEKVREFEDNAGLKITGWGSSNPGLLGKLVNFIQGKGALAIARDARVLRNKINLVVEAADGVLDACKEIDYGIIPDK